MDIASAFLDQELGAVAFTVTRTVYTRRPSGTTSADAVTSALGSIHPASAEELQLLPEEERHETAIVIHTDFALSTGKDRGKTYDGPDRITWDGNDYRVVAVREWTTFNYYRAVAVMLHEQ